MSGYFDPNVEAEMLGRVLGRIQGKQEGEHQGYEIGHNHGYHEGHQVGHRKGWDEAINTANVEILRQMEFTRQHIADKQALTAQLEQQRNLIEKLTQRLDEIERENNSLKKVNVGLREVVTALKAANEQLQSKVAQMNVDYQKRTQEYTDQLWQYNRSVVFMNSIRTVLEDLTRGSGQQADTVREMFAKRYSEHVGAALNNGTIRVPLDQDGVFAKSLPKTQKFIHDMLTTVANRPLEKKSADMMTHSQADNQELGM